MVLNIGRNAGIFNRPYHSQVNGARSRQIASYFLGDAKLIKEDGTSLSAEKWFNLLGIRQ